MKVTSKRAQEVLRAVSELGKQRVLVGVPAEKAQRNGEKLNNATLLYIHENGAPEANIPARRPLQTGLRNAQARISSRFRSIAKQAMKFEGNPRTIVTHGLEGIGMIAVSAVKSAIAGGLSPALADSTLQARARSGKGKKSALAELAARAAGQNASSDTAHPLLHTGELKNAITYVVRKV